MIKFLAKIFKSGLLAEINNLQIENLVLRQFVYHFKPELDRYRKERNKYREENVELLNKISELDNRLKESK